MVKIVVGDEIFFICSILLLNFKRLLKIEKWLVDLSLSFDSLL